MAFQGYLIKLGQSVFPLSYIFKESYDITPNRRQDLDPFRDANGGLKRNVVSHTATTISITTKPMWNDELDALMTFIRSKYINEKEKKVYLEYFCPDINDYKTGEFYIPDIKFNMNMVDVDKKRILYNSSVIEFIEY